MHIVDRYLQSIIRIIFLSNMHWLDIAAPSHPSSANVQQIKLG